MLDDRGASHADAAVPELQRSGDGCLTLAAEARDVQAPSRFPRRPGDRFFTHQAKRVTQYRPEVLAFLDGFGGVPVRSRRRADADGRAAHHRIQPEFAA